jgi:hypothetical protein
MVNIRIGVENTGVDSLGPYADNSERCSQGDVMPASTTRSRRKPVAKKTATRKPQTEELQRVSLSRAALEFLASKSPTPPIFDCPPEEPPFELQDH